MSETLVTVCVPTIGRAATLAATLDSLKRQSFRDYEVLILDNASPAEAMTAIARFVEDEPRARVLRSPTQLPMFANFQRGVDAASGKYVTFFHDDDVYREDFLERQVATLESDPHPAFVGSNCELIDESGKVIGERMLIRSTAIWPGWRYISTLFAIGSNVFPMQSVVLRRALLDSQTFASAGGAHYSDFVLLMRLAEIHPVGLVVDPLLRMRVHDEQASQQIEVGRSLDLRTRIFYGYCDELLSRWPRRRDEIERLRRSVGPARRSAALWAWMNAKDDRAAADSRSAVGDGAWLGRALAAADRSGLARIIRANRVRTMLRSLAVRRITAGAPAGDLKAS